MFTCETIHNGIVIEGSKEEFKDVDAVIQNLIESAAPEYCITVGMWLGAKPQHMLLDVPTFIDIPNGKNEIDRWSYELTV